MTAQKKQHTLFMILTFSQTMSGPEYMDWLKKEYDQKSIPEILDIVDKIQSGKLSVNLGQVI